MQVFINEAAYNKLLSMDVSPEECGFFKVKETYVAWKMDENGIFDTIETVDFKEVFPFFKRKYNQYKNEQTT